MNEIERREAMARVMAGIQQHIDQFGWSVMGVGSGERPAYAYTIGLALRGLPELLIIGNFPFDFLRHCLNAVALHATEKGAPEPGLLDIEWTYPFKIREAGSDAPQEWTIQASNYHGGESYRVLQVMICDINGRYPGDEGCQPNFDVPQP